MKSRKILTLNVTNKSVADITYTVLMETLNIKKDNLPK